MDGERTELIRVLELRKGANVRRYHTEYVIGEQTNAAHSHGVAMLLTQFYPHLANSNTLLACLVHDLPEGHTGDMPATIKWLEPELADMLDRVEAKRAEYLGIKIALSDAEKQAVYVCDYLEAMLFTYEQIKLGNRFFMAVYVRLFKKLGSLLLLPKAVNELIQQINFEVNLESA